ncbi:MAG: TetR/AcrR family transcriptional regulator [Actinobacteria bacterium]|nr:TetR/AcrR family transcriptional regulator [Actinomycetota bacterium]
MTDVNVEQPGGSGSHRAATMPVTERGRRTRAQLVDAARVVFEERGYLDARIGDITARADVAHGTFYTYFDSKQELFREVMSALVVDFRRIAAEVPIRGDRPIDRIERANRGYLRAYGAHARMMGMLENAALLDDEVREVRLEARRHWVGRAEYTFRRWQDDGVIARDIDVHYAANLLGSMVDRFAFVWLVLGEPFDEEESVRSMTRLYGRALGIDGA